jgi:ribose 5-phosphate isomerase A
MFELEKKDAAQKALALIPHDCVLGIGTGSTVHYFIEGLSNYRSKIAAVVSSSKNSTTKLMAQGFKVLDLNEVGSSLDLYVDGADEISPQGVMIKGGGGALTQEKILVEAARQFICIIDSSKCVQTLGKTPIPIEIIPSARGLIARKMIALGATPKLRENFITDNGNLILDVDHLDLSDPKRTETLLNNLPGVVTVGIFSTPPTKIIKGIFTT